MASKKQIKRRREILEKIRDSIEKYKDQSDTYKDDSEYLSEGAKQVHTSTPVMKEFSRRAANLLDQNGECLTHMLEMLEIVDEDLTSLERGTSLIINFIMSGIFHLFIIFIGLLARIKTWLRNNKQTSFLVNRNRKR